MGVVERETYRQTVREERERMGWGWGEGDTYAQRKRETERELEKEGEAGVAGGEREMQRRGASTNQRQNLKLLWILYCASLSRVLL